MRGKRTYYLTQNTTTSDCLQTTEGPRPMLYQQMVNSKDWDLLQEDLNGLLDWEKENKMSFHEVRIVQNFMERHLVSITLKRNKTSCNYSTS